MWFCKEGEISLLGKAFGALSLLHSGFFWWLPSYEAILMVVRSRRVSCFMCKRTRESLNHFKVAMELWYLAMAFGSE